MRGPARGSGVAALAAIAVVSIVATACDRTSRGAADDRPSAASTPTSAAASPCPAPALEPGYLPWGAEPSDRNALFADPERTRTWQGDNVLVQLLEGLSADHGDDPAVKRASVRDDDAAHISTIATEEGEVLLVDWAEDTRCGRKQYAVASIGTDETETLKVARSLGDGTE